VNDEKGSESVGKDSPQPLRRVFKPNVWVSLIALAMLAALISLGNWQRGRYDEKTAAIAHYHEQHDHQDPLTELASIGGVGDDKERLGKLQYRRAALTGELEPNSTQLLTARYMMGRRGYGVMMPLRVDSGRYKRVLVHLGWVPAEKVAGYLRDVAASPKRTIKGRLHITAPAKGAKPTGELLGRPTWLRAHPDAMGKMVADLEPRVLLQAGEQATGKPVNIDRVPVDGYAHPIRMPPSKHVEYMMTWYGLAVTLVCVWFALSFRKVPVNPVVTSDVGRSEAA